ncbi:MAG: rhomboid family intramembrane serine protease [Cyanobacteriota bacterium]|nr:rhomboid family intramembrane serine protease [Cyanobacteriota bacterium]
MAISYVLLHSPSLPDIGIGIEGTILLVVCLSCLSIFLRSALSPYHRGWTIVSGGILAIAFFSISVSPQLATAISASLWLTFVVLPLMGFARVNKLAYQQRYRSARRLAERLRWLHPADGWLEQPQILRALELGQLGEVKEAIALLQQFSTEPTPFGRNAAALQYVLEAQWSELRLWVEQHVPQKTLSTETNLLRHYLRSLGETGDLNALLSEGERYWSILERGSNAIAFNWTRMLIFAFCGKRELVVLLFKKSLPFYRANVREFWELTALIAGGLQRGTREQLLALSTPSNTAFDNAIAWRLSHPQALRDRVLTPASRQILSRLERDYQQEHSYARALTLNLTKAYMTYGLIALNLLFFAAEVYLGGSENFDTLYQLGALIPDEIAQGQFWRLINANFLHFGWTHLATNMFGLLLLGPFVELYLGVQRYLIVYFVSGVGSMLGFTWVAFQQGVTEQLLVGASASIMGLIVSY